MKDNCFKAIFTLIVLTLMLFACSTDVGAPGSSGGDGGGGTNGGNTGGEKKATIELKVVEVGGGFVSLEWTAVAGVSEYRLMSSNKGESKMDCVEYSGPNTKFRAANLHPGKSYHFQVVEYKNGAEGENVSKVVEATTDAPTLPAVTGLKVKATAYNITLSWDALPGYNIFHIYNQNDSHWRNYRRVDSSPAPNSCTIERGIEHGRDYNFKVLVQSNDAYGKQCGPFSEVVTASLKPLTLPVPEPVLEVTSYEIGWSLPTLAQNELMVSELVNSLTGKIEFDGRTNLKSSFKALQPGAEYKLRVRVIDTVSGEASPFSKYYPVSVPRPELPKAPANFKLLSVNKNSSLYDAELIWDAVPGAEEYHIYREQAAGQFKFMNRTTATNAAYSFQESENSSVKLVVKAVKLSTKESSYGSLPLSFDLKSYINPNVLPLKVSSVTDGSVKLSWNALPGTTHYLMMYSERADGEFKYGNIVEATQGTVNFLLPDKQYFFKVRKVLEWDIYGVTNSYGLSSNIVEAKTAPATLETPAITGSSSTAYSATISWNAVAGAEHYIIYRTDVDNGVYRHDINWSGTSFTDDNLRAGSGYTYRIAAYSTTSGAASLKSSEVTVTTKPATLTLPQIPYSVTSYGIDWELPQLANGEKLALYQYENAADTGFIYLQKGDIHTSQDLGKNIEPGKSYYYRFRILNEMRGEASSFGPLYTITIPQPELAGSPQNFKVDKIVDNVPPGETFNYNKSITLSWDNVAGADEYYIYTKEPWRDGVQLKEISRTNSITVNISGGTIEPDYYVELMVRAIKSTTKESGPFSASLKEKIK